MTLALSSGATEQLLMGQRVILAQLAEGSALRDILSKIAHYSEVCTPDMQASILWYEASTGRLRRGGHSRLPDAFADTVDGLIPGPMAGSCGTAAFRRTRVVSYDVKEDPLWVNFREFAAVHQIRSAWSTPLISPSDGSLLGVFGMYYPDTRLPSEEDLSLVEHFTHLAAIAIERNRRDEALRESEHRRHQGLLALTAGMAHELNTPLGVARTASSLLKEELDVLEENETLVEMLSLVKDNIDRGIALLRSFHGSVLDQEAQESIDIDVYDIIEKTVHSLRPMLQKAKLHVILSSDGRPHIFAPVVRVNQIITNIITNASIHAYGAEGGVLEISMRKAILHDGKVEICFVDQGRGMSAEEAKRCTDPFYTNSRDRKGTGLGLFVSRHVTEAELGGSMLLETSVGAGVRWTLLLPMLSHVGSA